jgi:phage regulator Rha-like protein
MVNEVSIEVIATKIFEIREKRVMLDRDLAKLYGVETKRLKEQVKRNIRRFPEDFMFQLTWEEAEALRLTITPSCSRSQIATLKRGQNIKYQPYVFTEQGVAMLSSVLSSERAIHVNIQIMRAFVKLKELLLTHKDLAIKIEALERKYSDHDVKIQAIFNAIKQLLEAPKPESPKPEEPKKRIGFHKE